MPQTAPFELVNNDNCLLDVCDMVVMDALGVGYGRLLDASAKEKYCSTQADADVFAHCIRMWLSSHKRWNSPVYIMGESYGTIRNAMVADSIFYSIEAGDVGTPIQLSGIINLGSALNYGGKPFPIPDAVLNLPSIAAENWYWHPEGKGNLKDFVDACDMFCYEEYVQALAMGKRMPLEKQRSIAEKLSLYTGYSVEKLVEDNLNVDIFQYPAKGMANEGRSIGIYDARFALGKFKSPEKYDYFSDDASNALIFPGFSVAFQEFWKDKLNITTEEEYISIWNTGERAWRYDTKTAPTVCLEKAMHRNPKMKVMFGMGYYDMLTTLGWVRYFVSHHELPKDQVFMHYYEAGHMPYVGEEQAMRLEEDIRAFILA